jgi:hypothetical protein
MFCDAIFIIVRPAAVLPVKTSLRTRSSVIRGATSSLLPVTTFSTPAGSAEDRCCRVRTTDSGVVGGGLTITVLPATSA